MSFDTHHGTHGARLPSKRLMNWINAFNMRRIRGKAPKVMGFPSLVLTTVGAKSGAPRHTPVAYFPDGPDSWLIVASAAGAAKNPDWYYNLRAHPDDVQIQLAGRTYAVCAEQLTGAAREHAWRRSPAPQNVSRATRRKPTANCRSSACEPNSTPSDRFQDAHTTAGQSVHW